MMEVEAREVRRGGFSMIEILVVLGIVGLLLGLALPKLTDVMGGTGLSRAADVVRGEINAARQVAATSNRAVVVRFFRFADPMEPRGEIQFRAVQYGHGEDPEQRGGGGDVFEPVGPLRRFADGVVALPSGPYSTVLSDPPARERAVDIPRPGGRPGDRMAALAVAMRVFPDGSTDLDASAREAWCVTLVNARDAAGAGGGLPADFVTLQVDPYTTQVREYRRQ